jgi:hypothetical protein
MARNRKYKSAVVRFGPALKAFVLCLLIGGSGVGYVWQKNQIYELGKQIRQREQRLKQLTDQNERLGTQLASMQLPDYLERRIKDLKLGLAQPPWSQLWHLPEPAREPAKAGPEQQLARAK